MTGSFKQFLITTSTMGLIAFIVGAGIAIMKHPERFQHRDEGQYREIKSMPGFMLEDIDGNSHDSKAWDGKVIVLNFWASWCQPCREEIPEFVRMQERFADSELQFVGIAIDDIENIRSFTGEVGFNYPSLVADEAVVEISKRMGNIAGVLPFTVVVDREGNIQQHFHGKVDAGDLETVVTGLL